jgi:hypothetical protein
MGVASGTHKTRIMMRKLISLATASSAGAVASDQSGVIADVVVTARKRKENLQNV